MFSPYLERGDFALEPPRDGRQALARHQWPPPVAQQAAGRQERASGGEQRDELAPPYWISRLAPASAALVHRTLNLLQRGRKVPGPDLKCSECVWVLPCPSRIARQGTAGDCCIAVLIRPVTAVD
jgi:hypothetical protein